MDNSINADTIAVYRYLVPVTITVMIAEWIIVLLFNITYITIFSLRPQLRNQTGHFNVGLAISSIMIAFGTTIEHIVAWFVPNEKYVFELARIMYSQGILWQCLVLAGCAIDRWTSIIKPLHYETIITIRRVVVYVIVTCIASSLFSLAMAMFPTNSPDEIQTYMTKQNKTFGELSFGEYFGKNYMVFTSIWVMTIFFIQIITISMYAIILCVLKKQMRRIHANNNAVDRPMSMY